MEIGKVKELSDTHIQVTVIPADSVSVTQEVLPNVMTEPEQTELGYGSSSHPAGDNHQGASSISTVQGPENSKSIKFFNQAFFVCDKVVFAA